jgi:pyridoxine 5'-phosphate synthase PdxJ
MDRVSPKRIPQRPDRKPMTADDIRELHDQIASFDNIEWIDDVTRQIVEMYMPDVASCLPEKRTETFDQAFGRMRAKVKRKATAKERPRRKPPGR